MDDLEDLPASMLCLEDPLIKAEEDEEEEEDRASHVSSGRGSDDEEPDPSTSPRAPKRRKKNPLDLSDVPADLPPIPSGKAGSASRLTGVYKAGKRWQAQICIPSKGGQVYLGTFESEEEAGIMFARARCKYPVHQDTPVGSKRSRRSVDHSDMQATQREPALGESDEVDGIVIEAFAGPSRLEPCSLGPGESPRPQSQSQSRPKKRSKSHRTGTGTGTARQRQARPPQPARQRPYRHQLFSGS